MPIRYLNVLPSTGKERWEGVTDSNCILLVTPQEKSFFCLNGAQVDNKSNIVWNVLAKDLYGKSFADRRCLSQTLFNTLFADRVNWFTGLRWNMKNRLMPLWDKIMLRKRYIIECINDMFKIQHSWYIPDIVP